MSNNILIKHRILLDPKAYTEKPSGEETRLINNRLINNPAEVTVKELAESCGENGHTWTPAYFEAKRTIEGWIGQDFEGLDFDNKDRKTGLKVENPITFEQVISRLSEYGLDCSFAYETFSHSADWHKFRVVFELNQCIIDREYHKEIILALLELFPEADPAPKSLATLFYGGKRLIYTNYNYCLNLDKLFDVAKFYSVRNSSTKNVSRDLKRVRKKLGEHKNGSKQNTLYNNNIENVENTSILTVTNKDIEMVRDVDFEDLRKEIKILDIFMNPEEKLIHDTLLGLATNLRYIEGGQELFHRCIDANPDYAHNEKHKIMTYCRSLNYPPKYLEDFSPYPEDWSYRTLLDAAKKKNIIRLHKSETITVEQARRTIQSDYKEIVESNNNYAHIINGFTGIGKTELYVTQENAVIAVPFHYLKNEIGDRMKVPYKMTPSSDELPTLVRNNLKYYHSVGAMTWALNYLFEMSKQDTSVRKYYEACLDCYSSKETVLTTHQKAIFINWKHELIILDENVISTLLPIGQVTMNDLARLEANLGNSKDRETLTSLINDIRQGRINTPRKMDLGIFENFSAIEDEVLSSKKYESDILHFFDSQYYIVDTRDVAKIFYIRRYGLPENKKFIILSATANKLIYEYLLKSRMRFYDLGDVELTGNINQITKYSCSRASLSRHLDFAVKEVGNFPVITFHAFRSEFYNPAENLYFGNCSGSDKYKGQDIAVVGTPHVNPSVIALYAVALGIPVKAHEFSRVRQQIVHHNGFRFWFNTYDNEYLRSIQFYFIESELKQAIGRARPYTTTSEVLVLSNYPLPEACINEEEIRLGKKKLEENRKTYLEKSFTTSKELADAS